MAAKKKSKSSPKSAAKAIQADLEKQVRKLTKQLGRVEAERDALVKKLTKQVGKVEAERDKLAKRLDKQRDVAKAALKKARATVAGAVDHAVDVVEENSPVDVPDSVEKALTGDRPDSSWTVTRLRAAAKDQGVPGYSRKTKQQLLDALS